VNTQPTEESIRVLIADDDEQILACYREAFGESEATDYMKTLDALDAELFDVASESDPGIDGVEAGSQIRQMDPDVQIVFVTGFSDVPRDELERRVPPPMKLHYFNKPLSFMKLAEDVAGMIGAH